MARATQRSIDSGRSSDSPRDAVTLLKQDHRAVAALFDEFEDAEDQEQPGLAQRICQMLTVHAQIEEEIVYPAAQDAFEAESAEEVGLVEEARVEHGSAKELIAKIEGMTIEDEPFRATVKVLGEYIKHHVKEEEGELFPKLKKTKLDLAELGSRLAERKYALMEQMGIPAEDQSAEQPAQTRKRASGNKPSRSSARSRPSPSGRRSTSRSGSSRSTRH